MSYRPKSLRKMPETTRKVARMVNEIESTAHRLNNLLPLLQTQEITATAEERSRAAAKCAVCGRRLDWLLVSHRTILCFDCFVLEEPLIAQGIMDQLWENPPIKPPVATPSELAALG